VQRFRPVQELGVQGVRYRPGPVPDIGDGTLAA
jgi:hypothetical protein